MKFKITIKCPCCLYKWEEYLALLDDVFELEKNIIDTRLIICENCLEHFVVKTKTEVNIEVEECKIVKA